ncbi:thiamine-binding protein, partial [Bacillus vallismortis]|nr:thiamine-binding protein [Bacillus vallismortis]
MEHQCGTIRISGFRCSIYPMSEELISLIKSAQNKT